MISIITPGRIVHYNPNMSKYEAISVLDVNRKFSSREMKVKYKILAIKYHPDKWRERCDIMKDDGMEIFKGVVDAYDILK